MKKKPVLILGSRSDIGNALAHKFAAAGHPLQLAARNVETLVDAKNDLEIRYEIPVTLHEFDVLTTDTHEKFVADLIELPELGICVVGLMGTQEENEQDISIACKVMRSNYEGPASIMAILAEHFLRRGTGTLVGISSVAGERGRAKNYVYGSAKAGFSAFLSGLRNRLAKKGIHVITVLPGFVATQMTDGMDLPARLTAQPEEVAQHIARAVERRKDVVYVRPIWRLIMFVIRNIPERIFKGMNI